MLLQARHGAEEQWEGSKRNGSQIDIAFRLGPGRVRSRSTSTRTTRGMGPATTSERQGGSLTQTTLTERDCEGTTTMEIVNTEDVRRKATGKVEEVESVAVRDDMELSTDGLH